MDDARVDNYVYNERYHREIRSRNEYSDILVSMHVSQSTQSFDYTNIHVPKITAIFDLPYRQ